jgi:geranylgeranyl diphosphate synthase type II
MALLQTIHARKTGALLGACCEIGAILAGASPQIQLDLKNFGEKVGLAFQVADDVLNETSTAEQLGKAVGSDSALNKLTYPRLIGLEASRELAHQTVEDALALITPLGPASGSLATLARYAVQRDW